MSRKVPTITIDLDRKCRRCGKGRAANGGLCLKCVVKALESGELDHVFANIKRRLGLRGR